MADARRKPNQAEKLLLGESDLHGATGGFSLLSGSRWLCGAAVGHGEELALPLSCPSGTGGRLCLRLPALCVPGCCLGSAGAAGDPARLAGGVSLRPAQAPLAGTPGSLRSVTQPGCATRCAQQACWHLLCRCFSNPIRGMEKRAAGQLRPAWQDSHGSAHD